MITKCSLDPIFQTSNHFNCENSSLNIFEGPEKRLQLDLRSSTGELSERGAREISLQRWNEILDVIGARIIDSIEGEEITSHLLTESSLFVSAFRIILITCGTTTLLNALDIIVDEIRRLNLEIEWMSFSRKNYSFPWAQKSPHSNMSEEYLVLKRIFPTGKPFVFGPIDADHYFFFTWDDIDRTTDCKETDMQLNLFMYGIHESVCKELCSEIQSVTNEKTLEIRTKIGLQSFLPAESVQDVLFSPCGYSINIIDEASTYYTIHVTPESHCSYASFETNAAISTCESLVSDVLKIFRPEKFSLMAFADQKSALGFEICSNRNIGFSTDAYPGYIRENFVSNSFTPGYSIFKANYHIRK